jgi:hypothetical protein
MPESKSTSHAVYGLAAPEEDDQYHPQLGFHPKIGSIEGPI